MNDRSDKLLKIIQLLGDLLLLNAGFILAGWLRFDDLRVSNQEYYNYYIQLILFFNLSWALMSLAFRIYDLRPGTEIRTSLGRLINAIVAQLVVLALLMISLKGYYYSRLFLIYFYAFLIPALLIFRAVFITLWRNWLRRGRYARRIWVIGNEPAADAFRAEISAHPEYGYRLFSSPADIESARELLRLERTVDELYCALSSEDPEMTHWYRLAEQNGLRFRLLPSLGWKNIRHARVDLYGDVPVVIPRKEPLEYWHNRLLKRVFDVFGSFLIGIILLWWLLPLLALIIRLDSPGSPWFLQQRSGINGERFTCFKLRTMTVDHDREAEQAVEHDERITRVGRFLRRHSIDELPQFFNVLFGDMSIVGPRPHMLEHTEEYRELIDSFMVRHLIKPGITGLAQVMGHRGETRDPGAMLERIRADVYYLEHWSVLLDIKIFFWTIWNMLRGK